MRGFAAIAAILILVGCGNQKQQQLDNPLRGLSEMEQRAAEAHAGNLCAMAHKDDREPADAVAGLSDLAVGMDKGDSMKIVEGGTALARQRGCVK
jgi:uncharacterized lipoprotein NlpE involved in copper resistance